MEPCHLDSRLLPVTAALCFSGQLSLESGKLLFQFTEVFWINIFSAIRGYCEGFESHIDTNDRTGLMERLKLHVCAAERNKIFARRVSAYRSRQYTPTHSLGYFAFHYAELGKLYGVFQHLDISSHAFTLVGTPMVMLAFETRIAGLLTILHAAKEILICCIEFTKRGLQCCGIYFFKPRQAFN